MYNILFRHHHIDGQKCFGYTVYIHITIHNMYVYCSLNWYYFSPEGCIGFSFFNGLLSLVLLDTHSVDQKDILYTAKYTVCHTLFVYVASKTFCVDWDLTWSSLSCTPVLGCWQQTGPSLDWTTVQASWVHDTGTQYSVMETTLLFLYLYFCTLYLPFDQFVKVQSPLTTVFRH